MAISSATDITSTSSSALHVVGNIKVDAEPKEDYDVIRKVDLQNTIDELRAEIDRLKVTIEMITWEAND